MENENSSRRSSTVNEESSETKQCWICFDDSNELGDSRDWASPCKCRGSTQWVHQDCVRRWIDERSKNDTVFSPHCPQCKTTYVIVFGEVNSFVKMLNRLDKVLNRIVPFITGGAIICAIYWSAVTYGALTLMQVIGSEKAITMLEATDPCLMLLMLPVIPVGLIFGKIVNLELTFLLLVEHYTLRFPLLRIVTPSFIGERIRNLISAVEFNPITQPKTTLCTALLLPTIAQMVGKLLFYNSTYSSLKKTLLGGLVYIAVSGAIRIYEDRYNDKLAKTRKAINYPDSDDEDNGDDEEPLIII